MLGRYMGTDMALFLLSPVFLLLLQWRARVGLGVMALLATASAALRIGLTAAYNFPPWHGFQMDNVGDWNPR